MANERQERHQNDADVSAQLLEAVMRADSDNSTAADVNQVRELLERHPNRDGILVLACTVENALIRSCLSKQRGQHVLAENEIKSMKKRFDYENSSGIEKALIDRVVICWLRVQRAELERATFDKGNHRIVEIEMAEKHLHMAHVRYLRAIEELAKVRFLMSRTNMARLQIVREGMKKKDWQPEPGKVLELKAG